MELPNNVDSKFRYILISAKRARQLQSGVRPLVQAQTKRATKIAQQEVSAGLIPFEVTDIKSDSNNGES
jgi:DNA-directed RNA polymerase subunit omega